METRDINTLTNWAENPRTISDKSFAELRQSVKELGQHSTFLITPEGIVLGGNIRLRAMREEGFTSVKCIVVDFQQEAEGWFAIVDGDPQRTKFYPSKEKAMAIYSFSHNGGAGAYDPSLTANLVAKYDIAIDSVKVNFYEPTTIKSQLEKIGGADKKAQIQNAFTLSITCKDELEQKELYNKLTAEGYKVSTK